MCMGECLCHRRCGIFAGRGSRRRHRIVGLGLLRHRKRKLRAGFVQLKGLFGQLGLEPTFLLFKLGLWESCYLIDIRSSLKPVDFF